MVNFKEILSNCIGILAGGIMLFVLLSLSGGIFKNPIVGGAISGIVSMFFGVLVNMFFDKLFNLNESSDV